MCCEAPLRLCVDVVHFKPTLVSPKFNYVRAKIILRGASRKTNFVQQLIDHTTQ